MRQFSTVALRRDFKTVTQAAARAPVAITQHRKTRFVLMPEKKFEKLGKPERDKKPSRKPAPDSEVAAFLQIWLAHRPYLLAYALRLSGDDPKEADDVLSAAMLKAAQMFPAAAIRNRRAWLLRLVHNIRMDRHRNNRRQSRLGRDVTKTDA